MYFVYVLQSRKDYTLYIGSTPNLKRRIEEHNRGLATYTKRKIPWVLIYSEIYRVKADAVRREKRLKSHGSAKYQLLERITDSLLETKTEEG